MLSKYGLFCVFVIVLFTTFGFSKEKNPTSWPYGGTSRKVHGKSHVIADTIALNFTKAYFVNVQFDSPAVFVDARFDSIADFMGTLFDQQVELSYAQFDSLADFVGTHFGSQTDFDYAKFKSQSDFRAAQFNNLTHFRYTQFDSPAHFGVAKFNNDVSFKGARFECLANFRSSEFDSLADFVDAQFKNLANFGDSQFYGRADFRSAKFDSQADFGNAQFDSLMSMMETQFKNKGIFRYAQFNSPVNFRKAEFNNKADFTGARFNSSTDFRDTQFDSIILDRTIINNNILIGSKNMQIFDFTRTVFTPNTNIIFWENAKIKLQPEKVKHICLGNIRYDLKRIIINELKRCSFKDDKKVHFELEYIFDKSTMFQEYDNDNESKWYYFRKLPQWIVRLFYFLTMDLGYRPFQLVYWILGIIIYYSIMYFRRMSYEICNFVKSRSNLNKLDISKIESDFSIFLKCFYFSVMIFFSFPLSNDILVFFKPRDQRIIIIEWLLGFGAYIAFIFLSKDGSILHTLKSLFLG